MDTKVCATCKIEKPITEFNKAYNPTGYNYSCKECVRKYSREHYNKNKRSYIEKNNRYLSKVKAFIEEFKNNSSCEICGESRPWCLDFHHRDSREKEFNIGAFKGKGIEKVKEEIAKCSVLCANCHRDIHYKENNAGVV